MHCDRTKGMTEALAAALNGTWKMGGWVQEPFTEVNVVKVHFCSHSTARFLSAV